jgi:hypothetical protein
LFKEDVICKDYWYIIVEISKEDGWSFIGDQ